MITNSDRSYYIGASDTSYVVGNWETSSFAKWWRTKQGFDNMGFVNEAMQAGTAYEHRILDFLQIPGLVMDKQVITGHLRINLDGCTDDTIYEVKTYRLDKVFTPPLSYVRQVNVEMFGLGVRKAYIVAYGLTEREYNNFYCDIDIDRLSFHPIEYDPKFIEEIYIPRLNYLSECLDTGAFPKVW